MKHELKIDPRYLAALLSGEKTFEIRLNDRIYQSGDVLEFHDDDKCNFANPCVGLEQFEITYVHSGLGLAPNYVALAVQQVEP